MSASNRWAILAMALILCPLIATPSTDAAEARAGPGLLHAPGDWWTYQARSLRDGESRDVTLVAVGDGGASGFGVTDEKALHFALAYEMPYVGARAGAGAGFRPVDLPLYAGKTWDTTHLGFPVRATVTTVDREGAQIIYAYPDGLLQPAVGVYDNSLGMLRSFVVPDWFEMQVGQTGTEWRCGAKTPTEVAVAFSALEIGRPDPAFGAISTLRHWMVHAGAEHALLFLMTGGTSEGYTVQLVEPSGATHQLVVPPGEPATMAVYHPLREVAGGWTGAWWRGGDGIALLTLLTYNVVETPAMETEGPCGLEAGMAGAAALVLRGPTAPGGDSGWALTLAFAAALAAAAGLSTHGGAWARRIRLILASALYAKVAKDRILDNPRRQEILDVVRQQPGITTMDVRRTLGIGWGTAVYHLDVLEKHGLLVSVAKGRYRGWFSPEGSDAASRETTATLRGSRARWMFDQIAAQPGIGQRELIDATGLTHSTVIFHLRRLETDGLVRKERRGVRVYYYVA